MLEKISKNIETACSEYGIKLPLSGPSLKDREAGLYGVAVIAQAIGRTLRTYAHGEVSGNEITITLYDVKDYDANGQPRRRPFKEEFNQVEVMLLQNITPDLERLYCSDEIRIKIVHVVPMVSAAQVVVQMREIFSPRSIPRVRAILVELMNGLPDDLRRELGIGSLRIVSDVKDEAFTMETEPTGTKDEHWYYQRYLLITVSTDRTSQERYPYININANRILLRRKGAEDYRAENKLTQSGPAEDRLLAYFVKGLGNDLRAPRAPKKQK